ncbi:MAG: GYD domain-containing protein [Dehalococcoidia bacterium]
MSTYIVLYNFTDQGAKDIKGTVQRTADNQADLEKRGFKVHGLYWTQGGYDLVAVIEAPDEESMMVGLLKIGAAGNARSTTMRAFTAAEMKGIVEKM